MTSIPPVTVIVNNVRVVPSHTQTALQDAISFLSAQHTPVPCVACDEDGRRYNFLAPAGQENEVCRLCNGTRLIVPVASPLASLENIAAQELLLINISREGALTSDN